MAEPSPSDDPMKAIMEVLREAQINVPELQGVAIISTDGLPMASSIDAKISEGELAALAS
jgi:predicted regulator of Ras-like GTPase activity (Roadblock/LC7/MglB family)